MEINVMVVDNCSKEIEKTKQALKVVSELPELKRIKLNPTTFSNPIDAAASKKKFRIALIEIEMSQMSGFELAAILKKKQPECLIIFLTEQIESYRMIDKVRYKVRSYGYLLKSDEQVLFNEMIIRAVDKFRNATAIRVKKNSEAKVLRKVDILYAQPLSNGCAIFDIHGNEFESRFRLKKLETEVPEGLFFKCYQSFLVNLEYCHSLDKDNRVIILKTEAVTREIPVSYKKLSEMKHAMENYRLKKGED